MSKQSKCCDKCYSTYTEKDWPAHTTYDACINQGCECHQPKQQTKDEEIIKRIKHPSVDNVQGYGIDSFQWEELEPKIIKAFSQARADEREKILKLVKKIADDANIKYHSARADDNDVGGIRWGSKVEVCIKIKEEIKSLNQ